MEYEINKRCSKCGHYKPLSKFYKSTREKGGYRSRCKSCCVEDNGIYAQTGYYKRYNKAYEQKPEVKERRRITKRAYRQRPDVKIKNLARWYTNHEIRAGRIKREPCAGCGKEQSEAHHLDYDKPLLIVWLCPNCHKEAHLREEK